MTREVRDLIVMISTEMVLEGEIHKSVTSPKVGGIGVTVPAGGRAGDTDENMWICYVRGRPRARTPVFKYGWSHSRFLGLMIATLWWIAVFAVVGVTSLKQGCVVVQVGSFDWSFAWLQGRQQGNSGMKRAARPRPGPCIRLRVKVWNPLERVDLPNIAGHIDELDVLQGRWLSIPVWTNFRLEKYLGVKTTPTRHHTSYRDREHLTATLRE